MGSFKMQKSLREIAKLVCGEVVGDGSVVITGVSGIKEASAGDITFLANPKYFSLMDKTLASAVVVGQDIAPPSSKPAIRVENPSLAFVKIASIFTPYSIAYPKGIHPSAILGENVLLGKNVAIGAYAVIENDVSIGDNTIIYPYSFIGHHTGIGSDTLIYPHVSIRERITIGNRVIIHSGTVVGSDGFGFVTVGSTHHKIPQIGTVEIGDDVEIGANVAIDRARFDKTIIGRGTKIDNLVQIAHNVVIGEDSIIVAQAGISGSTTLGKGVTLAGQAGLVGHITIGDGSIIMAQSGVTKSFPPDTIAWGTPAKPGKIAKRINACVQSLPKLYDIVAELKKKIAELEKRLTEVNQG
jgi:UDP-3-O-[3-hydroxymyristoyl] glucosamine N-acyltransferase